MHKPIEVTKYLVIAFIQKKVSISIKPAINYLLGICNLNSKG